MSERNQSGQKLHRVWFFLGLAAVAVMTVPCLLLGEDAIFTYHDQLDGELIAYILQARHLFRGDTLPEFMGGVSKTALIPPAPGFVPLFLTGRYFVALLVMQMAGSLAGYLGMYLLAREVHVREGIAAGVAVLFAYLPFLPVYGLSQYGLPLLFWCVLQLRKKRHTVTAYLYVACYALTSSLVLVGFGLLGMGALWLLWLLWKQRERAAAFLGAWLMLLGIYVAENYRLLGEVLGMGNAGVSHKSEYSLAAAPFFPTFLQNLTRGGQHSEDYHLLLLAVTLVILLAGCFFREDRVKRTSNTHSRGCFVKKFYVSPRKTPEKRRFSSESAVCRKGITEDRVRYFQRVAGLCLLWNLFFSLAAAFWDSGAGVWLRSRMAALGAFQMNRLLWIAPVFWYLAFACGGAVCLELLGRQKGRVAGILMSAVMGIAAVVSGARILLAGDVKSNIQKLRNPDYGLLSYRDYYAVGVMEQVESFLREMTGLEPSGYRVVSLGIDPAAALYHGFYCLDGYSNNYPADYKHAFRRVLAPELERSEYLRAYFDDWGNRCYLFSSECPAYYTIEKGGFYFQEYRLDAKALKELGGDYLLSAAYIANAREQGLVLLNETPLETEDSYYRIYIYAVAPEPAGGNSR